MERTMTVEEKIRRAEEIYARRQALFESGIENNGSDQGVTDQSHVSFHVYKPHVRDEF